MPIDPNDPKNKPAAPVTDIISPTQLRPPPPPPTGTSNGPRRGGDGEVKATTPAGQKPRVTRGG